MKFLFIYLSILIVSVVQADIDYFIKPTSEMRVPAGETIALKVSQLPDIDGQTIYANVYAEGSNDAVMTIRSWSYSSVSDSQKNNFEFDWPIPANLCKGRYYVKIDINNDQDDNDICRSYTIEVYNEGSSQERNGSVPPDSFNHNNPHCEHDEPSSDPIAGKTASNGGVLRNSISRGRLFRR